MTTRAVLNDTKHPAPPLGHPRRYELTRQRPNEQDGAQSTTHRRHGGPNRQDNGPMNWWAPNLDTVGESTRRQRNRHDHGPMNSTAPDRRHDGSIVKTPWPIDDTVGQSTTLQATTGESTTQWPVDAAT